MRFFDTLLVPIDFSSHSSKALDYVIALAKTFGGCIHLLHAYHLPIQVAIPEQMIIPQDFWTGVHDVAARKLERALQKVNAAGVKGETHLSEFAPAQAITRTAEEIGADLIVMGTRGLAGLKHVLLGSIAERTISMATCPVMTVKDTLQVTEPARLRTILVPIDFSECSHRALALARSLAKATGPAHLILIHACFMPFELQKLAGARQEPVRDVIARQATEDLERILAELQDEGISAEFAVHGGTPELVIEDAATEKGAEVIVMGTRGRIGLAHVLIGSVAQRVLRTAPCPVVTVKAQRNERRDGPGRLL